MILLNKQCSKCKMLKHTSEFFNNCTTKTKFSSHCKVCSVKNKTKLLKTQRGHISKILTGIRMRVRTKNIPFNLSLDYVNSITTETCPIFGTSFDWGIDKKGHSPNRPSLDRVIPELGYVKGNVVFISTLANRIKQNVTEKELYAVADWLHDKRKEVLNAFKNKPTPVPENHLGQSQTDSQLGAVLGARSGQDCDGTQHYRGEPEGKDADHSAQARCRICLGSGMFSVGTSECHEMLLSNGVGSESLEDTAKRLGCVCYQCGECSLVG